MAGECGVEIIQAGTPREMALVRSLFTEYADWLDVDLCFQNFHQEVGDLPGIYAPPEGRLLLALAGGRAAGCVGLCKLDEGIAEMKRFYVRPQHQGQGIGWKLAEAAVSEARKSGYQRLRLDTLPFMKSARHIYRTLGFQPIPPYCDIPVEGVLFMELVLRQEQ